jgi:tight adherence protein C
MSAVGWWCLVLCVGVSTAAVVLLCLHTFMQHRTDQGRGERLPAFLAGVRWPALLVTPLLDAVLPQAFVENTRRVLDSHGWLPQLTPQLWVGSRVVHAVIAAGIVFAVFGARSWQVASIAGLTAYLGGGLWLRHVRQERERQVVRELPAYLDLLTVCVEAGATLTAGVRLIVAQAPVTPLRGYFERVLREVRGGRPRAEAFVHVAGIHDVESLTTLANALAHAEGTGMSLGQVLRTQSEQRTAERFARAERLAMQAPVKMLGPLIFCIFPCTFIVLAVPIVVRMLEVFRS